jgi:hypothetical protein
MFAAQISTTGASAIYVDGKATAATASLQPLNTPSGATAYIGAGSSGDWWKNPIEELILWAGILSDSDRQKLMGYYAWRWNLVGQLPSGHAYKTAAPTVATADTTRRAIRYSWAA